MGQIKTAMVKLHLRVHQIASTLKHFAQEGDAQDRSNESSSSQSRGRPGNSPLRPDLQSSSVGFRERKFACVMAFLRQRLAPLAHHSNLLVRGMATSL
jgi:hypothetical protein